jgi:hypothetical protein
MKKTYYIKEGRKYFPVAEYDSELIDGFHKGTHVVVCYPGGKLTRYNIEPAYAPMIAAGRVAEDAISEVIMKATEIRRHSKNRDTPLTPSQKQAWDNLVAEFGEDARQLEWPSARECAQAAVKAMEEEAVKLMNNESVKLAYDHFQCLCDLSKDH